MLKVDASGILTWPLYVAASGGRQRTDEQPLLR